MISRKGWATFDDSDGVGLDALTDWWASPSSDEVDSYFFGFGSDYKGAVRALSSLTGKAALAPRYALGVWWTRWFDLGHDDVLELLDRFEEHALPLDVFVLDMK